MHENKLDGYRPEDCPKYTKPFFQAYFTLLCRVYFGIPINVGPRNKRGCF